MRIRFHLQNGIYKNHWQIKNNFNKLLFYLEPKNQFIRLTDCVLINKRKTADKIYSGSNKTVCSWIDFRDYELLSKHYKFDIDLTKISYNPKKSPFWNAKSDSGEVFDLDDTEFKILYLGVLDGILGVYGSSIETTSKFEGILKNTN